MTLTLRSPKLLMAALVVVATIAPTAPALSAQADIDLLKSYIGDWRGTGKTTTANGTETVRCKLDITNSAVTKIKYNGRCTLAGGNLSINGTMAYITERRRFEAVMSSNTAFSGIAIGKRRGRGIDFMLRDRDPETGAEFQIDAGIALNGENINVKFSVLEKATGRKITASVPFKK